MSPDVAVSHATNTVSTSDWGNTVLKLFFYDGWQCVEETNTLGVVQKKYVFGEGIDEVVKATLPDVNDIDGDMSTTDQVDVYYHHNSLGSVVAVTNGSGTIAEEYTYTAYGEVSVDTKLGNSTGVSGTTQIAQPLMFTGRRLDFEEESGLYYYRLRQYDPVAGRFTGRDPLGLWGDPAQRGNGQNYCSNNPVNRVDPLGLQGWHEMGPTSGGAPAGGAGGDDVGNAPYGVYAGVPLKIPAGSVNWWAVEQDWRLGKWRGVLYNLGYNDGPAPYCETEALDFLIEILLSVAAAMTPFPGDDFAVLEWGLSRRLGTRARPPTVRPTEFPKRPTHLNATPGKPKKIKVSKKKYPEPHEHAVEQGNPTGPFTMDRTGTKQRRRDNLRGKKGEPGKDRDEWPPASTAEGEGASVKNIDRSQNRGAGATIGNKTRDVPDGGQFEIEWTDD